MIGILLVVISVGAGVAPADSLDLVAALRLAREHSPALVGARADVRRGEALVGAARSARAPRLTTELLYLRYEDPPALSLGPSAAFAPLRENNLLGGLRLEQPLYTGGRLAAGEEAAEAMLLAARARARDSAAELDAYVARSFDDLLLARALFDVAVESVAVLEEAVRVAEEQGAAGTAARIDALRAETRLSSAQAERRRAAEQVEDARERLAAILGMEVENLPPVAGELTTPEPGVLGTLPDTIRTTRRHPALEALDATSAARDAEAAIERSARRPSAGLQLGVFGTRPEFLTGRADWGTELFAAVGVRWNLFDFGHADRRAEALIWEGVRLRAVADAVEDSLRVQRALHARQLDRALEDVAEAQRNVGRAEEVLGLAEQRYAEGIGIQLEVLEAQAELARIRGELYTAVHEARRGLIGFRRAAGIPIESENPYATGGAG